MFCCVVEGPSGEKAAAITLCPVEGTGSWFRSCEGRGEGAGLWVFLASHPPFQTIRPGNEEQRVWLLWGIAANRRSPSPPLQNGLAAGSLPLRPRKGQV
ncbi:hypothetical protein GDO81_002251 [Engystomops pustulosus]|uniref:Uncharacterized protein n=1 Tax=Engystomops pustulosus TaxID=76066 RepID=A0AAV7DK74_ENGPU|nr:hypothetical protein GDO81_002251 [Engystomops pustulosus]